MKFDVTPAEAIDKGLTTAGELLDSVQLPDSRYTIQQIMGKVGVPYHKRYSRRFGDALTERGWEKEQIVRTYKGVTTYTAYWIKPERMARR